MPSLLDFVTRDDEVVGQGLLEEAIEQGLWVRVIGVFIINDDDKILLQWRSASKKFGPRLFDASVGGHVDAGEDYFTAAHREMQEEMGIKGELTEIGSFEDLEMDKKGYLYWIRHNGPFSNWEEEADQLDWFSLSELEHMLERFPYLFTGGMKGVLPMFKQYWEKNNA